MAAIKQKRVQEENKKKSRQPRSRLKERYGITEEEYYQMALEQGYRCKICNKEQVTRRFCVDHCHKTGRVRGLLCSSCNKMLGLAKDNQEILHQAIFYLAS